MDRNSYKKTIIWIDDNALFLKAIERTFAHYFSIKTFHDPVEAINFIEGYAAVDSEQNNEISVMVVDYMIPGMNGIEICRALKTSPLKKILLTGASEDDPRTINAINEGIIDLYVQKDSQDLVCKMKKHIEELINQYFFERKVN